MDVYEAITNLRSMRRLKPDHVPDELVRKVLEAAIRAASGGNQQNWSFLLVRDSEKKKRIGTWYKDGLARLFASGYGQPKPGEPPFAPAEAAAKERTKRSAQHLADNFAEVPVLIFACLVTDPVGGAPNVRSGASIYPAVQNLMLAASAEGLGTTLTTVHAHHDNEIKEYLNIPANVVTAALVTMGWPTGTFGPGPRRPLAEVTYVDSWGNRPDWP